MSNLGMYQVLTTVAKRVGGPLPLIGLIAGSGIAMGAGGMALYYKLTDKTGIDNVKPLSDEARVLYCLHKKEE